MFDSDVDDPRDYIDPEEGREEPRAFFTWGEPCENCGSACEPETRVFVPGWDFWVCGQCAEECRVLIFAEENCRPLYRAITRARTVAGVQAAFRWHRETCLNCTPKITGLPVRRPSRPEGAQGTGQPQEKAA